MWRSDGPLEPGMFPEEVRLTARGGRRGHGTGDSHCEAGSGVEAGPLSGLTQHQTQSEAEPQSTGTIRAAVVPRRGCTYLCPEDLAPTA